MRKIYREHLEILISELKRLETEHPKANVYFDIERNGIQVIYPLPKDFYKIKSDTWIGSWEGFGGDPNNPYKKLKKEQK